MKITQAVFGVFHHFALARELERRGHLEKVYSTWPWLRLKRELVPRKKVETFPWIHTPEILLNRLGVLPRWLSDDLGVQNALRFDDWTLKRIGNETDAFIAIAGAGLKTGQLVQRQSGKFICDRGSTHQRYQEQIVSEEYKLWGVNLPVSDFRDTLREEEIYAVADAITVPSTFALRSYVEMGVPQEKLHLIPYGADLDRLIVSEFLENAGGGGFNVLFAGAVGLRKGVPYLLKAFERLKHPGKHLRLVGHVEPGMGQLLARLPTDGVEMMGSLPRPSLNALMHEADVLVLPSIEDGFGLVMAEAMACGCTVISSTNTGGSDLYSDNVEGFIVPIRDSNAIASRLQQLADDRNLLTSMQLAAKAKIDRMGGWTEYGDRWMELLRSLVGKT